VISCTCRIYSESAARPVESCASCVAIQHEASGAWLERQRLARWLDEQGEAVLATKVREGEHAR
jgi:hypothetical protein